MKKSEYFTKYLFLIFFLAFSGYYVILILLSNNGLISFSRYFTVPVRIFIAISLFVVFKNNYSSIKIHALKYFYFFSLLYFFRILLEANLYEDYHLSELEFFLYYLSFVFFPIIFISKTKFTIQNYNSLFYALLLSSVLLSLLTIFYYSDFIGLGARITDFVNRDQNYVSPLALSYCGTLLIGVSSIYILHNKINFYKKGLIILSMILGLIPFFLGSSRGSIFALIVPFIFYLIFRKGFKRKFNIIALVFFLSLLLLIGVNYLGSSVFDRFLNIQSDINSNSTSSYRLIMYQSGIEQFVNYPLFGNSLELTLTGHHPHNIFIEILISTGLFGFIPFIIFIFILLKKSILILNSNPQKFWVCVIFLQALIQNLFTGAIYGASWLAIGSGLILATSKKLNK